MGQGGPSGGARLLAVDDKYVYWTGWGTSNAVLKAPASGGTPVVLAANQSSPFGIAVDATSVYWASNGGSVGKVPLGGGAETQLAQGPSGANNIAVDATSVYWTIAETTGSIMKVPLGGGASTTIAANQFVPTSLAVDAANAYWTTEANTVVSVPLGGGATSTLATAGMVGQAIAVDGTSVYWESIDTMTGNGTLMKTPAGGGASVPLVVLQGQNQGPVYLAIDATNLYWTEQFTERVNAAPLAGGAPVTLAAGQNTPYGVAVNATAVFWVNIGDGTILKVAK
jgi:hypothetical protein